MQRDDPDGYDRDYKCDPGAAVALRLWTPEAYRYAQGHTIPRRALSIDGAVTRKATSDLTAITVGGAATDPRKVVIEHAEQGRIRGLELRERIWEYAKIYPRSLRVVLIETNNGGDRWREVLEPFPECIEEIIEYTVSGTKRQRIEGLHRHYDRGAILHATRLPELEDQQCAWDPTATEDDLLDSEAGLVRWALTGWPGDGPPPVVEPDPPPVHRGLRSVPTRRTR